MKNRVVITGMGAITPIGNDIESFWNSIKEGKCGIDFITRFDTTDFKATLAAEIKGFNPEKSLERRSFKKMDRFCQLAVVTAKEAIANSKLDLETIDKERFGIVVGSGIGGIETIEEQYKKFLEKGPTRVSPMVMPMIIGNMAAGNIAIEFGAKGICYNVVTACATGTNAIGEAFHLLQNDRVDIMIAGGAEAGITPLMIAGFTSMTALSTSADPLRASIPFDKDRDGFIMGEGAGILILETLQHAQKRGAKIYGEVVGYGATCDAYHITSPAPDGDGGSRAMKMAIKEAGIKLEEISYINAHGTSTTSNDKVETLSIKNVFGELAYKIPISSTKSMTGHMLGAAGAVEAIVCIKAMEEGFVPPTIGYVNADPECDLDYVPNKGRKAKLLYTLSNSLGFGGHNAAIILKAWR